MTTEKQAAPTQEAASSSDVTPAIQQEKPARERIKELKVLLDDGLISPDDFEAKKIDILKSL